MKKRVKPLNYVPLAKAQTAIPSPEERKKAFVFSAKDPEDPKQYYHFVLDKHLNRGSIYSAIIAYDSVGHQIGILGIESNPNLLHINGLGDTKHYFSLRPLRRVKNEFRRKGLATIMLRALENVILEYEKKEVIVSGATKRLSTLRLFLSNGYKVVDGTINNILSSIDSILLKIPFQSIKEKLTKLKEKLEKDNDLHAFVRGVDEILKSIKDEKQKKKFAKELENRVCSSAIIFYKKLKKPNKLFWKNFSF